MSSGLQESGRNVHVPALPGLCEQVAAKIAAHTEGLTTLYDMVFTSYEKNYVIYHLTVCGNTVCGYTTDPKFAEQAFYKHIQDILKKDNYREVSVKIFNDLDKYLTRCDQLKSFPHSRNCLPGSARP